MSHAQQLWELLLPLGPYSRQGIYTAGELAGEGRALDEVSDALSDLEREAMLDTAEGEGLEAYESLLAHRPVAGTPAARRAALSALLRIGGDSFTLAAINDNLRGCGINAAVSETGRVGVVEVRFPDVPGIPEGFEQLRKIVEEILPCHLDVEFYFRYLTWAECEGAGYTWAAVDKAEYTWEGFQLAVPPED